jgi:hypothetical protein
MARPKIAMVTPWTIKKIERTLKAACTGAEALEKATAFSAPSEPAHASAAALAAEPEPSNASRTNPTAPLTRALTNPRRARAEPSSPAIDRAKALRPIVKRGMAKAKPRWSGTQIVLVVAPRRNDSVNLSKSREWIALKMKARSEPRTMATDPRRKSCRSDELKTPRRADS